MIFLEIFNRAVEEILLYRFENAKNGLKFEKFNQTIADFDGAIYHLRSAPNDRSKIIVSITLNFFQELQEHGANEVLQREYGQYLLNKPEDGCSVSLLYDLEHLPENYTSIAQKAALLKRNCFAAVFEKFFEFHASMGEEAVGCKKAVIHYRPNETLYISALADRVTVIFSTVFKHADDLIIAKVFLQELTEVRRRFDRAPQVLYSQSVPPSELIGTDAAVGENVAYITFDNFNEDASFLGQYSGNRTINKKPIHHHSTINNASPELSSVDIFTNNNTPINNNNNKLNHSDLLHRNLPTAVTTTPITATTNIAASKSPVNFITHENHQTAV
ncbi:unnamed protein product [Schistosoma turkestanicum]|nr:unnamed protein product [Schistosoma turkestanicum]